MTRDASENFHICQPSLLLLILLIFVKIVTAIEIFLHKVYNITSAKRSPVRYPPKLQPQTQTFEASTYESIFRNSLKVKVKLWFTYKYEWNYKKCESKILKKLESESEIHMSQLLESENYHDNSEHLESKIIIESIHKWEHLSELSESEIDHVPDNMQSVTDFNTPKLPAMTFDYDGNVNGAWHGDHYNDHWTDLKTACLNSSPWNPLPLTSMLATMKFRWLES